jgi:predicted molibdopterin-dependent oxidoreductase YjgC
MAGVARASGADWGWESVTDVWTDIRANVPTHAGIELERITQESPPTSLQYESGFEDANVVAAQRVAGPGGGYPKGYRSGAPFQTGQNWPLSWELRAFEARQRPGVIPRIEDAPSNPEARAHVEGRPQERGPSEFVLYTGRLIYDEGAMVSKSSVLHGLARRPFVELHEDDAEQLGLSEGDEVVVAGAGFEARCELVIADIARGAVFVPYNQRGLAANRLMSGVDPVVEVRAS